jgi:broad specificity phosphatase PhoE
MGLAIVIRHGACAQSHVLGMRPAAPLTGEGQRQVRELATRLSQAWRPAIIVASPLLRALQTAQLIAEPLNARIVCDVRLGEMNWGYWDGKTPEELAGDPKWEQFHADRGRSIPPGGEPMRAVQERIIAAIGEYTSRKPEQSIAFVSHADPIRAALCHYFDMPLSALARFEIAPASAVVLRMGCGRTEALAGLGCAGVRAGWQ